VDEKCRHPICRGRKFGRRAIVFRKKNEKVECDELKNEKEKRESGMRRTVAVEQLGRVSVWVQRNRAKIDNGSQLGRLSNFRNIMIR